MGDIFEPKYSLKTGKLVCRHYDDIYRIYYVTRNNLTLDGFENRMIEMASQTSFFMPLLMKTGRVPDVRRKSSTEIEISSCTRDDETNLETERLPYNVNKSHNEILPQINKNSKVHEASIFSSFRNNQSNSSSKIPIVTTTVSDKAAVDLPPIDSGELMMKVIRSPIGLGYFLAFCESEFNSEYLKLFVAVEKFRNTSDDKPRYLLSRESSSSEIKESWREIDESVVGSVLDAKTLPLDEKRKLEMINIWDNFFNNKDDSTKVVIVSNNPQQLTRRRSSLCNSGKTLSPNYVFLSETVSNNTIRRMEYVHLYGSDVFTEAVTEALRTLHREIFPRFMKSDAYTDMINRRLSSDFESTIILPANHLLVVRPPKSDILTELGFRLIHAEGKLYSLKDIMRDGLLFNEFNNRLKIDNASAYLLCPRMITIFRESVRENKCMRTLSLLSIKSSSTQFKSNDAAIEKKELVESIKNQAWTIYLFFVAKGSAYEMPLSDEQKKAIQLSLANPSIDMFFDLEAVAMTELLILFNKYKLTENYKNLAPRALRTARNILKIEAGTSKEQAHPKLTKNNIH